MIAFQNVLLYQLHCRFYLHSSFLKQICYLRIQITIYMFIYINIISQVREIYFNELKYYNFIIYYVIISGDYYFSNVS